MPRTQQPLLPRLVLRNICSIYALTRNYNIGILIPNSLCSIFPSAIAASSRTSSSVALGTCMVAICHLAQVRVKVQEVMRLQL